MTRRLDQPPYSTSCQACTEGEEWVCVPPGKPLTGDEQVIRFCGEHAVIVQGTPGWRRVWDKPQLPGVPLDTYEFLTVVARRLEDAPCDTGIPVRLRQQLANVFRDTARKVTLAGMMNGSAAQRYVDQRFHALIELAEVVWDLEMPSPASRRE